MIRPDPARVERVMADTGMDRLQAVRHEQQRMELVRRSDEARRAAVDRAVARMAAVLPGVAK